MKLERVYIYASIFPGLASLSFLLPVQYIETIWGGSGHNFPIQLIVGAGVSLILGVLGIIVIVKRKIRGEDFKNLIFSTFSAASFFLLIWVLFFLTPIGYQLG